MITRKDSYLPAHTGPKVSQTASPGLPIASDEHAPARPVSGVRAVRTLLLGVGPFLTMMIVDRLLLGVGASDRSSAVLTTTLLWSPLFCSIPALLTQSARDAALADVPNPSRALRLLPHLMFAPSSPVRVETSVAFISWSTFILTRRVELFDVLSRMSQLL